MIFVYVITALYRGCGYWKNFLIFNATYLLSLLFLFGQFYVSSYLEKKGDKQKSS